LADIHFAPTEQARGNLIREGIASSDIMVTGNTVVDALLHVLAGSPIAGASDSTSYILVTAHRRENHGAPLHRICDGLIALLERHREMHALVPMHPSPEVRDVLTARIGCHRRIRLIEPLGYKAFVSVLNNAALVMTDSGGVQEECAVLNVPMLVLREGTERPEALVGDDSVLVGTDARQILESGSIMLSGPRRTRENLPRRSIFGDGNASTRILDAVLARGRLTRRSNSEIVLPNPNFRPSNPSSGITQDQPPSAAE
jgi:UDP-N-acetylglucosamine 2-epimerase (non-hydrolysing)